MNDLLSILRDWWKEIDGGKGDLEQPIDKVCKLLVKKKICPENESAKRIIIGSIRKNKSDIDWEDFN